MRMGGMKDIVVVRRTLAMPKYLISWTEENWYNITIEADSAEEAKDKFYNHEFDYEDSILVGSELQDSVEAEEV
jgi:hypothetical protein